MAPGNGTAVGPQLAVRGLSLAGSSQQGSSELLIGRDKDLKRVRDFVDHAATEGGALLLSGDAGVGKTVLLDAGASHAIAADTRVLRAAGVEFEAHLTFAGLNQVLHPLFEDLDGLGKMHRGALSTALGLEDGSPSDKLVVCNAAVALLLKTAVTRPILVVVDDLQWLDRASAFVLGFIARRLAGSKVGFLAASRTEDESFFDRGDLPGHELDSLDDEASAALLADRFPAMAPRVRQRLLVEAQGNPLALLELPAALTGLKHGGSGTPPAILPLTERLKALFASRIMHLPESGRELLLLAALDGTGDLRTLQLASGQAELEGLAHAERARFVHVDIISGRLAFRHPLTRSAVVELSTSDQRRHAHRLLAQQYLDQPERRAWHLADASVGSEGEVASLLEQVAGDVLRRADAVGAIAALLRAAELSPQGFDRSRRLAKAAYIGADVTGDLLKVPQLLDDALKADPGLGGSLTAAIAASYHLLSGEGDVDAAHRLVVGAIETVAEGDFEEAMFIEALHTLLLVCFFGGRADLWDPFDAAISRLTPRPPELLDVLSKTFPDPARTAQPDVLERLDALISDLRHETDPVRIVRVGIACAYVDRLPGCRDALWRVVGDGRSGGAITSAIESLFLLCNDGFLGGNWDEVLELTDEGLKLCEVHGYRVIAWPGLFYQALIAAARGDYGTTKALTDEIIRWASPRRVGAVQLYAQHARALGALSRGDFEEAYTHATAVSEAGVLASHVPHALWVSMDLVEAAVRTGRHKEAVAHVAAVQEAGIANISPRLALTTAGSAALVATDHADGLFEKALAVPGCDRWPFDFARVQLLYGERLRRLKATAQAREHLTAALNVFQRLDALPWAERAGHELRATGISIGRAHSLGPASLTPQEKKIGLLAAEGLSNKEIGERLFLSHRTVGTHLYRLYPKLGITSRAALRDALAQLPEEDSNADQDVGA